MTVSQRIRPVLVFTPFGSRIGTRLCECTAFSFRLLESDVLTGRGRAVTIHRIVIVQRPCGVADSLIVRVRTVARTEPPVTGVTAPTLIVLTIRQICNVLCRISSSSLVCHMFLPSY